MIWAVINFAIYLVVGALLILLVRKRLTGGAGIAEAKEIIEREIATKSEILEDLAKISLGLTERQEIEKVVEDIASVEEKIRSERGKATITEAEIEAIDLRLRELEELKRELEVSSLDSARELEMLKSQQRDLAARNDVLRQQLSSSSEQIDYLLGVLTHSAEGTERMMKLKAELADMEQKIESYMEQIAFLNQKYMSLKQAYDALDIEYAQLYEKQQLRD